ncbi:hypothetical protein A7976_08590 [Methylobacillus sp. MM3]|uniref:hypothetical protein n=1 Tax=Methylobacillus sp. MM3 TaxID=1848039 RepID=UPI0007DE6E3D|nr:hypothetical protein [Methylobacillus sp. MM3]OAJ71555.1 hypothetical protein A7976_08590 [Methylobacillus sp. MM3]
MTSHSELVRTVKADIIYLRQHWDQTVDDDSLRRASPIFRRLVVDNDLQRAWKDAGQPREPQIQSPTLEGIIAEIPLNKILFAAAGGAHFGKEYLAGALIRNYAVPPEELQRRAQTGVPTKLMGLREFANTPVVIVQGIPIPRRIVIKYVANKLGGAHFDPRRESNDEGAMYELLDKASTIALLGKPAIYFELLSAGQALANAPDIQAFL